jgi:hypothetical protein
MELRDPAVLESPTAKTAPHGNGHDTAQRVRLSDAGQPGAADNVFIGETIMQGVYFRLRHVMQDDTEERSVNQHDVRNWTGRYTSSG